MIAVSPNISPARSSAKASEKTFGFNQTLLAQVCESLNYCDNLAEPTINLGKEYMYAKQTWIFSLSNVWYAILF